MLFFSTRGRVTVTTVVCLACLTAASLVVPGLFEGLPGADRARPGLQPAAGPAAAAGGRRPGRQQGPGAAGSVQHPHRCARRQLMNYCRHPTNELTAPREGAESSRSGSTLDGVTIYEL